MVDLFRAVRSRSGVRACLEIDSAYAAWQRHAVAYSIRKKTRNAHPGFVGTTSQLLPAEHPVPPNGEQNMSSRNRTANDGYQSLLGKISEGYTTGQMRATQAVNVHITETYWQIGHDIVEFEQGGNVRAKYGKALLTNLSRDLSLRHGKGFSRSNVIYMRLLYLHYQKGQKPSDLLSWSHQPSWTAWPPSPPKRAFAIPHSQIQSTPSR